MSELPQRLDDIEVLSAPENAILATEANKIVQNGQRLSHVSPVLALVVQPLVQHVHDLEEVHGIVRPLRQIIKSVYRRGSRVVRRGVSHKHLRGRVALHHVLCRTNKLFRHCSLNRGCQTEIECGLAQLTGKKKKNGTRMQQKRILALRKNKQTDASIRLYNLPRQSLPPSARGSNTTRSFSIFQCLFFPFSPFTAG